MVNIKLSMLSPQNLDSAAKAMIVRCGLGDRDPKVKDACKVLILKWLSDYTYDVPKFLRLMDFEMYEDEAETLGYAVMEIIDKGDNAPHDLNAAVRQYSPDWEQPVSKMVASEIFWAFIRCSYASKNMSPVALADFVDILVPDMIKLCSLLMEAKKPALYCSAKSQLVVRYLLKMTAFLDTSDLCGCQELVKVCEDMLSDTNLPEILVDPMLTSWLVASSVNTTEQSILAAVALSLRVAEAPSPTHRSRARDVRMSSDCPHLPGDSDDEDDDEETVERMRTLSSIRSAALLFCPVILSCLVLYSFHFFASLVSSPIFFCSLLFYSFANLLFFNSLHFPCLCYPTYLPIPM
jgi:hypothetical protein